jgi:GT2 family glycosyltransferase
MISIVIVNYNSGAYLAAAVASILRQDHPASELIVVDNHSRDGSLDALRESAPAPGLTTRIVELPRNTGFAHGCNVGIEAAHGSLILLLNPDCEMRPDALGKLARTLDEHPEAGMVGPRLVNADGSEQRGGRRDIPNPWQIFCYIMQLHRWMSRHPRFRDFNRLGDPLPEKPVEVQAISGACMLVRRSAIDDIGLMDEDRFFLHFEDLDWCLRFNNAGQRVLFVPDAVVQHAQGVSSAKNLFRAEFHKHRSLIRFLRKHFAAYYPSSFMAAVAALVAARFCWVALRVAVRRRPALPLAELRSVATAAKDLR